MTVLSLSLIMDSDQSHLGDPTQARAWEVRPLLWVSQQVSFSLRVCRKGRACESISPKTED